MDEMTIEKIIEEARKYKNLKLYSRALVYYLRSGIMVPEEEFEECLMGCFRMGWFETGDRILDKLSSSRHEYIKEGIEYCIKNGCRPDWIAKHKNNGFEIRSDQVIRFVDAALENNRPENAAIMMDLFHPTGNMSGDEIHEIFLKIAEACFNEGWSEYGMDACCALGIKPRKKWLDNALNKAEECGHREYIDWLTLLLENGEYVG
jgi:hypothetical protein